MAIKATLHRVRKALTDGAVRWIEGTKFDPSTDHAWYRFYKYHDGTPPRFHAKLGKAIGVSQEQFSW